MKEMQATLPQTFYIKPGKFIWSYLGTFLFMLGGCIENSWLSAWLNTQGFDQAHIGQIFAGYGIVVAITSWLSGVCVDVFGPKKVMVTGFIVYLLASVAFLNFALPSHDLGAILVTYMLRGVGYPLVCYSFLVRLTIQLDNHQQGIGTSLFWVVYNLGFTIIGPVVAASLIPELGHINVMWAGMGVALLGVLFMLVLERNEFILKPRTTPVFKELSAGISIMYERPRIGLAVIVKTINGLGTYGFVVVLPLFLLDKHFTLEEWASIWGITFISNQVFNIIFGWMGDKIGFRRTIQIFGSILTGVATLIVYWVPMIWGHNYVAFMLAMCLWGAGLAGFVPMTPLVPMMAPDKKGAANSAVNFGSGLGNFVGPALVSVLAGFGTGVVMYTMAGLYLFSGILVQFLKVPGEK
ncbi:TPA: MFS transporter [Salmonella enterica subsp. enterica serovar Typhimurium]|nr:MFS transporter [Salmonella enterica subsp. enterica serovar Typhimurium]EBV8396175.1 MFS transporter [Salmonella enterica subsp. enterica serovar Typhimurium]ECD2643423.1 MFS transporter [Salmonella enterica subsp. enterica serovar Typhimurium]ECY7999726.1 MFS transporter [Salmonella enterica subsp. enterica serovar Typhimurium]EHF8883090.1 MFS transporter [Salmonella enterica subsp. enterica serovar Typhimurium]